MVWNGEITNVKITTGWSKFRVTFDANETYNKAEIIITRYSNGVYQQTYPSIPYTTGMLDFPSYSYLTYKLSIRLQKDVGGTRHHLYSDPVEMPGTKGVVVQSYYQAEIGTDYTFLKMSIRDSDVIPLTEAQFRLYTPPGYPDPVPNSVYVNYNAVVGGFFIPNLKINHPYTVWMTELYAGPIVGFEGEGIPEKRVAEDRREFNFVTRRLTTITARNTMIGSTLILNISRSWSGQRNETRLKVRGSNNAVILEKTFGHQNSQIRYDFTESEIDLIAQHNTTSDQVRYSVEIDTIERGAVKGVSSASAYLLFSSISPTFKPKIENVSYVDINTKANDFTGDDQTIVQNQSQLQFNIGSLVANKYSKLTRLSVQIGSTTRSKTYSNISEITNETFLFDKVNSTGNDYAIIQVTDSRGFIDTKHMLITIVPYSPPQHAVYSATRLNGYEDDSYLNYTVLFTALMENDFSLSFRIKEEYAEEWEPDVVLTEFVKGDVATNFEVKENHFLGARSNEKKFIIELTAADYFEESIQEIILDKGKGLAIIDKDGWAWQERIKGVGSDGSTDYMATIQDVIDLINQR